jgi:hypothetical protein
MGQICFHETSVRSNHFTLCVTTQNSIVLTCFAARPETSFTQNFSRFIESSSEEAALVFLEQSLVYSQIATQTSAVVARKSIVTVLNHGLVILSKHVAVKNIFVIMHRFKIATKVMYRYFPMLQYATRDLN